MEHFEVGTHEGEIVLPGRNTCDRIQSQNLAADVFRHGLRRLPVRAGYDVNRAYAMRFCEFNDTNHPRGIRVRIDGRPLDRDLIQTVFRAVIPERLVRDDDFPTSARPQRRAEFRVQPVAFLHRLATIFGIILRARRVDFLEKVANILEFQPNVPRRKPHVRVATAFMLVFVFFFVLVFFFVRNFMLILMLLRDVKFVV